MTTITDLQGRLDAALTDMHAFTDKVDATGDPTDADVRELNRRAALVTSLAAQVRAANATADKGQPNDPVQRMFREMAYGGSVEPPLGGGAGAGTASTVAPLGFGTNALAELHKGALARHVTTKDAITITEAPMSGIPAFTGDVFPWLRDKTRLLDLIPTATTTAPEVFYFRSTAAASAADTVAPGANKPYSEPTWEQVDAPVRKIAHYTRVNDEVIADFDRFLDVLGTEMVSGLIDAETAQLLNGSGVAPDLTGLLVTPGINTIGSAGTDLDAVAEAANVVRTSAFVEPDVAVLHPNDFASSGFQLAKDSTGQYLLGNPLTATRLSLWGMTVVLTTAMTENTLMVANLKTAAKAYVRQPPTLEVAPFAGSAEFIANQTLIRAEERLALTVQRPQAICLVSAV